MKIIINKKIEQIKKKFFEEFICQFIEILNISFSASNIDSKSVLQTLFLVQHVTWTIQFKDNLESMLLAEKDKRYSCVW
jgi:hypothetical protein